MSRVSKPLFFFIIAIYTWNIVLRYPNINGPHDGDGYAVMWASSTIDLLGVNNLLLSPLSYAGMYPYSSPFGTHHYLVAFNQLTDLGFPSSVYFLGLIFTFLGLNGIFLLTNRVTGSVYTSVISLLFLTSAVYFTNYTYWSISTRAPFMAIMPIFCDSLLRLQPKHSYYRLKDFLIFISLFLLLQFTHRMYTFVAATIIFPFLIFSFFNYYKDYTNFSNLYTNKRIRYSLISVIFFFVFVTIFFPMQISNALGIPLTPLWIVQEFDTAYFSPLLNLIFTYLTGNMLSGFVIIGLIKIYIAPYLSRYSRFLIIITLFSTIFITNYEYFYPIFLTFFSVIGAIGLKHCFDYAKKNISKEASFTFLVAIFLIMMPYTYYVKELRTNINLERHSDENIDGYGISQESYNQAFWQVNYIEKDSIVIDVGNTDSINWICHNHRVLDHDNIAYDPNFGDIIEIETYGLLDTIFHTGRTTEENYHYGGVVKDWSGVYTGDMPVDTHNSIMLYNPDSFFYDIYRPEYAIIYNSEAAGKDSKEYELTTNLEEESYVLSSNELWETFFIKTY